MLNKVLTGGMAVAVALALGTAGVLADEALKSYSKKAPFDDVKADVADAIIAKGLTVDYRGNIAGMLDRTGKDVGSDKKIYKAAEYVTFCSAKLSRAMMEADSSNMGICPYVVFYYETADNPGTVVVGYRRPGEGKGDASKKALKEIDDLLDGIAKAATK